MLQNVAAIDRVDGIRPNRQATYDVSIARVFRKCSSQRLFNERTENDVLLQTQSRGSVKILPAIGRYDATAIMNVQFVDPEFEGVFMAETRPHAYVAT
jgi:hypothetical protein